MNFVHSIVEATGIIEEMYGSKSKQMKRFQKVLQGYAIKKTKTRKDITAKFEQLTKGRITDKILNDEIDEILYWMIIHSN